MMDNNYNPLANNPQNPVAPTAPQATPGVTNQVPLNAAAQPTPTQPQAQQNPAQQPIMPNPAAIQNAPIAPAQQDYAQAPIQQPKKGGKAIIAIVVLVFLVIIALLVSAIFKSTNKAKPVGKLTDSAPIYESKTAEIDDTVDIYSEIIYSAPVDFEDVSTSESIVEYKYTGSEDYSSCQASIVVIKDFDDAQKYAAILANDSANSLSDGGVQEVKTGSATWYRISTSSANAHTNMYHTVFNKHLYQFTFQSGQNASDECSEGEQRILNSIMPRE